MYKRTLVPILFIVSLLSIAYAVYRSTAERITTVENGHEVVYGEAQHGLILGLLIFAGICVISAVSLIVDRPDQVKIEPPAVTKRQF